MSGEYIYKNSSDTVRVKIFQTYNRFNEWDADIFKRSPDGNHDVDTYSQMVGDYFFLKKDAKEDLTEAYGKLTSINPVDTVTEGWE